MKKLEREGVRHNEYHKLSMFLFVVVVLLLFGNTAHSNDEFSRIQNVTPQNVKSDEITKAVQEGEVKGKITDASGAPLPGVTIIVKGTMNGTVSWKRQSN